MILIGSAAARIRDCLPDWRDEHHISDFDLIGTEGEFDALADYFRALGKYVITHERGEGLKAMRVTDKPGSKSRILIDYSTMDRPCSIILDRLDDYVEGELFGQPIRVCSLLTQYVTKRAYARLPIHREKNDADIAFWRPMVAQAGLTLTPDHIALFAAIRSHYMKLHQ